MPDCRTCGAPAEMQWRRHATDAEAEAHWAALEANIVASGNPDYVQDRSGPVHVTEYGCGDHALTATCTHLEPQPVPCPDCRAVPGVPCVKPDGTMRPVEHPARVSAQPQIDTCDHAHDADCGGYGACHCTDTSAPMPTVGSVG